MSMFAKALDKMSRARAVEKRAADKPGTTGERPGPENARAKVKARRPAQKGVPNPKKIELNSAVLSDNGILTDGAAGTQLAEQFRRIKRPLLDNAFSESQGGVLNQNVLVVTSALPNEGKTFVSLNLALSMAREKDRTVLLVDADVAKPGLSHLLEMSDELGLLDVLADDSLDISAALYRTDVAGLSLVPAGRRNVHANELLASNRMSDLIIELANRYPDRIIVCDSPPMLVTTEAQVVAGLAGQIAVVVNANRTPQKLVRETLATLDIDKPVNLILNKCERASKAQYYGGYYGHKE